MSDLKIQLQAKHTLNGTKPFPGVGKQDSSDSQLKKWVKKMIRQTLMNKTSPDLIRISTSRDTIKKNLSKISVPDYVNQISVSLRDRLTKLMADN